MTGPLPEELKNLHGIIAAGEPALARWALALLFGALAYLLLRRLRALGRKAAPRIASSLTAAHGVRGALRPPVVAFRELILHTYDITLATIALTCSAWVCGLPYGVFYPLRNFTFVVCIGQVAIWASVVVDRSLQKLPDLFGGDPLPRSAQGIGRVIGLGLIWIFAFLTTLSVLGVDITALVAGLGIGGVAVALAVQNILGDLFASLSIVLDRPFEVGDFIQVGDHMGSVERVGLKTTRIRSLSGEELIFANSDLLASRIRNYKRMAERRVVFTFGVGYDAPRERLAALPGAVAAWLKARPRVRFDRAHFQGFGEFALNFEVVYFVLSADYVEYMDIQQALNLALMEMLEKEGLSLAHRSKVQIVADAQQAPRA